ncbi:hypothetical protein PPYR_01504 [Photinus pyralis]|uniref:Carboxylic ester hydrolase n=1 Tax=Photinus pyralis TaxID=7054 RepID=A0A1Y1LQE6_PHOPY|nr:esterase B1-like isoform X1 [Photinus pyralis]KAB0804534.1 hypothetical protein PPYR_01504 [Photinus pyralis]
MEDPIVVIKSGKLRGKVEIDYCGGKYYSFRGIPYAKPPIGNLRFKAPLPPDQWSGIRDAVKHQSECCCRDLMFNQIIGSEDCLYLNVYTPQIHCESMHLKPVMFWIHGGGFVRGSGNSDTYGPDFLITQDVVIVTINYRLGILGFLNFEDPSLDVPGNAGLKDQVMGLKWVRENIANFGGDPSNVTIFGESAGAASVHLLMLSPLARDLFHKGIVQSGTAFSWWANGQRTLPLLQLALDMSGLSEEAALDILLALSTNELIELQERIPDNFLPSFRRPFVPVVESHLSNNTFLSEEPIRILKSGSYSHVPMMIGFTSREGMISDMFRNDSSTTPEGSQFVVDFESMIPHSFNTSSGTELSKTIADIVKQFYFGTLSVSKQKNQYYLMQGDSGFIWPTYMSIKHQLFTSAQPIYLYRVSIETDLNIMKMLTQNVYPGACHADDLGYLFMNALTPPLAPHSLELQSVKRFTTLWGNFAKTGNPNPITPDTLINVPWKPVEKADKLHYLEIGENLTVGINPDQERAEFWDDLSQDLKSNKL